MDPQNCLLEALHWQVTGGLLRAVPSTVRETSLSSFSDAPEKWEFCVTQTKSQAVDLHVLDPGEAAES